jgi:CHASE3 domain sensor protein
MRIIGEFDKGPVKVTVFKMNERISVKYEYHLMELTYKFRDGSGIENLQDVIRFSNDDFMQKIKDIFQTMEQAKSENLAQGEEADPLYEFEII